MADTDNIHNIHLEKMDSEKVIECVKIGLLYINRQKRTYKETPSNLKQGYAQWLYTGKRLPLKSAIEGVTCRYV